MENSYIFTTRQRKLGYKKIVLFSEDFTGEVEATCDKYIKNRCISHTFRKNCLQISNTISELKILYTNLNN